MSKLVITRPKEWINKYRRYKIFLDGNSLGEIKNDEILEFELPNGQHTIKAKIDWCSSNEMTVTGYNNEPIHLKLTAFKESKWLMPLSMIIAIGTLIAMNLLHNQKLFVFIFIPLILQLYFFTIRRNSYLYLRENNIG